MGTARRRFSVLFTASLALLVSGGSNGQDGQPSSSPGSCGFTQSVREATVAEVRAFFSAAGKTVVTFVGYSGSGYEDEAAMLVAAAGILDDFAPAETIVNIGATPDGIGAVYELAARRGFVTTGIVSTQAREQGVQLSPCAARVFYIKDHSWGGMVDEGGRARLSPTSEAMVGVSDVMVGIGGGEVARDELLSARAAGRDVRFIPADMNHQRAIDKARKRGLPAPQSFHGAAADAL